MNHDALKAHMRLVERLPIRTHLRTWREFPNQGQRYSGDLPPQMVAEYKALLVSGMRLADIRSVMHVGYKTMARLAELAAMP